jgi:hypothetical protein
VITYLSPRDPDSNVITFLSPRDPDGNVITFLSRWSVERGGAR